MIVDPLHRHHCQWHVWNSPIQSAFKFNFKFKLPLQCQSRRCRGFKVLGLVVLVKILTVPSASSLGRAAAPRPQPNWYNYFLRSADTGTSNGPLALLPRLTAAMGPRTSSVPEAIGNQRESLYISQALSSPPLAGMYCRAARIRRSAANNGRTATPNKATDHPPRSATTGHA